MNAKLKQNHELFAADPDNAKAFNTLVEHYYFDSADSDWNELVSLYHQRLTAPSMAENVTARVAVLVQLAQLLEERCFDIDQAVEYYTEAARLDATSRAALGRLRKIYATRNQWDMVLQIADVEGHAPMTPSEKSAFEVELGDVWGERIGDFDLALQSYESALEADAANPDALSGIARALQKLGRTEPAIDALEKLAQAISGAARAAALVDLGRLVSESTSDSERATECFRRALTSDPHNADALASLIDDAKAHGRAEQLADLYERYFDVAAGAKARTSIAIDAGHHQLRHCGSAPMARMWFERALELEADSPELYSGLVEVARELEDDDLLRTSLSGWIDRTETTPSNSILLEAASLQADNHNDARALKYLNRARQSAPEDPLVLEALAGTLTDLGRFVDLVEVLENQVEVSADDAETRCALLMRLGRLYDEELADTAASARSYQCAFDAQPETAGLADRLEQIYRASENWSDLRTLLERANAEGPEAKRTSSGTALANLLWSKFADSDAAIRTLEAALDFEPGNAQALEALQRIARESGDETSARSALEREALSTGDDERRAALVREISASYEADENWTESLRWIERQLEAQPSDVEMLCRAADLCEKLGQSDALVGFLERVVAHGDTEIRLSSLHRMAETRSTEGRFDDAIRHWEACAELEPGDSTALQSLKRIYRETQRLAPLADTIERLADALEGPDSISERNELAGLLADQIGDSSRAIAVYEQLARLSDDERPADAEPRFERLLEDAGRSQQLADHLQRRAARLAPDDPEADQLALRRAHILIGQLDRPEEAIEGLHRLHERRPDFHEVTDALELAARSTGSFPLLAALLEERAAACDDPRQRAQLVLERAEVLDDVLEDRDQARRLYEELIGAAADSDVVAAALPRLERILTLSESWQPLRTHLEKSLSNLSEPDRVTAHLRIADLCRDQLDDPRGCSTHLEALLLLDSSRGEIWRRLSELYDELADSAGSIHALAGELSTQPDSARELVIRIRLAKIAIENGSNDESALTHYERVFEIDSSHWEASHYLLETYERADRHADVLRVLQQRLAQTSPDDTETRDDRSALLLRISSLQQGALEAPADAVETLSIARAELGPNAAIAEPLALLLDRLGRPDELIDICREMSIAGDSPDEQTGWRLRLARALEDRGAAGDLQAAADAYAHVVGRQPNDRDSESSLLNLYRTLDQPDRLAAGLQIQIDRCGSENANAIRFELAELLADRLERPDEALRQYMAIVESEPEDLEARASAGSLARRLRRFDEVATLLRGELDLENSAAQRAELLEAYGELHAGELDQPEVAVDSYLEAIRLAPDRFPVRRRLRELLERSERWAEALDCLFGEASRCDGPERLALYEHGADIATTHLGPDFALPWLMRLRSERPGEPNIINRIAALHRGAGRTVALLRSLEEELGLHSDIDRRCELHCEIAELLARELGSPARAVAALEDARRVKPRDTGILGKLEDLYREIDDFGALADALETRIELLGNETPSTRADLHRQVARLAGESLRDPQRAVDHWQQVLALTSDVEPRRAADLQALSSALAEGSDPETQARVWESELALVTATPGAHAEREVALRLQLAEHYARRLASGAAAAKHLRRLLELATSEANVDGSGEANEVGIDVGAVENQLLAQLRLSGNVIELEQRLARHLERAPDDSDAWLELARLRDESLHASGAAADAYQEVVERDASNLQAIRGLRQLAERRRNWPELARTLELELAADADTDRFALLQRLGQIQLEELGNFDAARKAYASALEERPADLTTLRALQHIAERREDPRGAIDYYEREIASTSDDDPIQRQKVWLRIAELASELGTETQCAIDAYGAAEALAPTLEGESLFAPAHRRKWAGLYRRAGQRDRHAQVMTQWCDDATSGASCADHLDLAEFLEEMDQTETAAARAQRAAEVDPTQTRAWDLLSRLCDALGRTPDAARALGQAAELVGGPEAASRLCRASELIEDEDASQALALVRRAVERDPGSPTARAALARLAEQHENWEEAETAAARAVELAESLNLPDDSLRLACALVGGRAARRNDRSESAARFFSQALAVEPDHLEALENQGELLYQRGDVTSAQHLLERRLELPGEISNLAHHLVIVGTGLELADRSAEAVQKFEQALEADADCEDAHAAITRLHEETGELDEALLALELWIENLGDSPARAAQLIRAAEIESGRENWHEAEGYLRAALEADPQREESYLGLVRLLERQQRLDEVIEIARRAETHVGQADARAELALATGRALEAQSSLAEAAEAFGRAHRANPRLGEAALCEARLLRAVGDWEAAATGLAEFIDHYPDAEGHDLAQVYYERGRIMAGPLEDTNEAIRCYEAAVAIEPDFSQAREPLANLLSHLPEKWTRAVEHHRVLLKDAPTATSSLRSLVRIASQRGSGAHAAGLSILRSLGVATAEELADAPDHLPYTLDQRVELENPVFELLRQLVQLTSAELVDTLRPNESSRLPEGTSEAQVAFSQTAIEAAAEISAPHLCELDGDVAAEVFDTILALAHESDPIAKSPMTQTLTQSIGRWTRRKLRKAMEGSEVGTVSTDDAAQWQSEVRAWANCMALDRSNGDLRTALSTLLAMEVGEDYANFDESADLTSAIGQSEAAVRLMRRVIDLWCADLSGSAR